MTQTFTRLDPANVCPGPAPARGADLTRPLAPVWAYRGQPALANWGPPAVPPPPAAHYSQGLMAAAGPAVWSGPDGRSVLPPAPWGMIGPAHGVRGRKWGWIASGGAAALAVTVGVIAAVAASQDDAVSPTSRPTAASATPSPELTPPSAPTAIDDAQLPRMVPLEAHAAELAGAASLEPIVKTSGPGLLQDYTNPAGCAGALVPATETTYDGTGVRATYVQALHDPDRHQLHLVVNAVSTFDSTSQATQFATTQAVAWEGCQGSPILLDAQRGNPTTWVVSDVTQRGDLLTARVFVRDTGAHCQRALTAKLNVVIDSQVCTQSITEAAAELVTEIAGHVGQAT